MEEKKPSPEHVETQQDKDKLKELMHLVDDEV